MDTENTEILRLDTMKNGDRIHCSMQTGDTAVWRLEALQERD